MERDQAWYKVKWEQGAVLENEHVNISWDFEYNMRKESTARRPDVTIEYKERKVIHLVDMALLSQKNVLEKNKEKRQKYQQLAFEVRERETTRIQSGSDRYSDWMHWWKSRSDDRASKENPHQQYAERC